MEGMRRNWRKEDREIFLFQAETVIPSLSAVADENVVSD